MVETCTPPGVCIGWKGYVLVDGRVIPYNSSTFSERIMSIPAEDIHGGGVGTTHGAFHSLINAAEGQIMFDGNINGNVYIGDTGFGLGFREMLKRAIGGSATDTTLRECGFDGDHPLIVSWGGCGYDGFKAARYPESTFGRAVVETMTLNGNPGGLVTWDASLLASSQGNTDIAPTLASFTFESGSDLGAGTPVPYFESKMEFSGDLGEPDLPDRITNWSITINNNAVPQWTFNGERSPRDIYMGQMKVDGNFEYYSDGEDFTDLLNGSTMTLTLGVGLGAGALVLRIPYVVLNERPITVSGPNDLARRTVNFYGLGDSTGGSIYIAS